MPPTLCRTGTTAFECSPSGTNLMLLSLQNRLPRSLQRKRQRLLRNTRHKRSHHPSQPGGNTPRQRRHFALHIHAAIPLLHPPPRFHFPPEPIVIARLSFPFICSARIFYLPNPHCRTPAMRHPRRIAKIMYVVLRI